MSIEAYPKSTEIEDWWEQELSEKEKLELVDKFWRATDFLSETDFFDTAELGESVGWKSFITDDNGNLLTVLKLNAAVMGSEEGELLKGTVSIDERIRAARASDPAFWRRTNITIDTFDSSPLRISSYHAIKRPGARTYSVPRPGWETDIVRDLGGYKRDKFKQQDRALMEAAISTVSLEVMNDKSIS